MAISRMNQLDWSSLLRIVSPLGGLTTGWTPIDYHVYCAKLPPTHLTITMPALVTDRVPPSDLSEHLTHFLLNPHKIQYTTYI
jgi:hypothetical protein